MGRFAKIGIPCPRDHGPFSSAFARVVCGVLFCPGTAHSLRRRYHDVLTCSWRSSRPKVPILLNEPFWIFALPRLDHYGFWSMAPTRSRTDFAMLLASIFSS